MTIADAEAKRILAEYKRRDSEIGHDFYALTKPANLFARQGQQQALLRALERSSVLPLEGKSILDVGCGRGQWLATFADFGATRNLLAGADLNADRVIDAKARFPDADIRVEDATQLPWADKSFDLVLQATMFTSILDSRVRFLIAAEMKRVVKPDGIIIWYDFRYDNPRNRNVRGISAREVSALFKHCTIEFTSTTLAPPLARALVPRSWLVATALERARIFNTHYLAVIRT